MSEQGANGLEALLGQISSDKGAPLMQIASQVLTRLGSDDTNATGIERRLARLVRAVRLVRKERDLLVRQNRAIAHGLGACECWGNDPECRDCGGNGTPGYFEPEAELFAELVVPLIESQPNLLSRYVHAEAAPGDTAPNQLNDPNKEEDDGDV